MTEHLGGYRRLAGSAPVSEAVVEAVAAATGAEPATLDPPLFTFVDPDALDRLFDGRGRESFPDGQVAFTMAGCRVVVTSDGAVTATPDGAVARAPSEQPRAPTPVEWE